MIRALGMDLSLNHGALVELTDGEMSWFNYYIDKAGAAVKHKEAYRMNAPALDAQFKFAWKLAFVDSFLRVSLGKRQPDYASLEDFAYRAEQGAHQLGGVGGVARLACWRANARLRLYNPMHAKMYAAHNGHASKEEMAEAVLRRWHIRFDEYNQPFAKPSKKNPNPKQNVTVEEDLVDAYVHAQLVWAEVQLRAGTLALSGLEHNKERQIFLKVSKTYPINVLARAWVCRTQEED